MKSSVSATQERLGAVWHVEGLLIARGTQRNRRLIGDLAALFSARYPASSHAWLRVLVDRAHPKPGAGGLAWTDVEGERLLPSRLRAASR